MSQDAKQLEDVIKTIQSLAPPPQSLDKEIKTLGARTADFVYILEELAIRGTAIDSLQKEVSVGNVRQDTPRLCLSADNLTVDRISK